MKGIEPISNVPALATVTDTSTLRGQLGFLEAWRQAELERAEVTTGPIRASCLAQLRHLDAEIARNNRFLAQRGF